MLARDTAASRDPVVWYGLGWAVRPTHGDANWWHDGRLPGTATLLVRAWNGLAWVALFNSEGDDGFGAAIDRGMWQALAGVTSWPEGDGFGGFR